MACFIECLQERRVVFLPRQPRQHRARRLTGGAKLGRQQPRADQHPGEQAMMRAQVCRDQTLLCQPGDGCGRRRLRRIGEGEKSADTKPWSVIVSRKAISESQYPAIFRMAKGLL